MATYLRCDVENITLHELEEREADNPHGEFDALTLPSDRVYANVDHDGSYVVCGSAVLPTGHGVRVTIYNVRTLSDGCTVTDAGRIHGIEAAARFHLPPLKDEDIQAVGAVVLGKAIERGLFAEFPAKAIAAA